MREGHRFVDIMQYSLIDIYLELIININLDHSIIKNSNK